MASSAEQPETPHSIPMPAPTPWPMVLAAGVALIATGLMTSLLLSLAGLCILVVALAGWIGQLLPGAGEMEEPLAPLAERAGPVAPSPRKLTDPSPGHRLHLPEQVHPYSAGAKGGLAGGALMALVALAYGLISGRGLWYPINLLAAMVLPGFAEDSVHQLAEFHFWGLVVGAVLHLTASVMVGLFFGVILPTLPRSPIFWGGIVGPLLWTAAIYGFMGVLNPVMNQHVDWPWFIASQFVYGLTVGFVVTRSEKVAARRIEGRGNTWLSEDQPTAESDPIDSPEMDDD